MNAEYLKERLEEWGEVEFVTDAGGYGELHKGDVYFTEGSKILYFTGPNGDTVRIPVESIEDITEHTSEFHSPNE